MRYREGFYLIVACLALFFVLGNTAPATDIISYSIESTGSATKPAIGNMIIAGETHDPIVIDGDDQFNDTAFDEGWVGNGSAGNPFIIDRLDINVGGSSGHCISISNTRVNFTISNCNLTGANLEPGSGIYLYNVDYGKIINNTFLNDFYTIYLQWSDNNIITNNTCYSNDYGICLSDSDSNTILNNTCFDNWFGIYLVNSGFNTPTNNTCYDNAYGIYLSSSYSNSLINNTCFENTMNGICIYTDSDSNNMTDNTCYANNIGIRLYFADSNNMINNTCFENSACGISLDEAYSSVMINNTCSGSTEGIILSESDSCIVLDNTCCDTIYGIRLSQSHHATVTNNTCHDNYEWGISLSHSSFNTLTNNTCYNNTGYGIRLYSDSTAPAFNTITNNICYDNGYGIYFYVGYSNNVTDNTCYDNGHGIDIRNSNSNNLINNTCYDNAMGVTLYYSDSNTVSNNTCYSNDDYAIYLDSSDSNNITWNVFLNSNVNGYDTGTGNIIDFNYWSDYIGYDADGNGVGDIPYSFSANQDPHPLMAPPGSPLQWLQPPTDQVLEYNDLFTYDINASVYGGLDHWWLNDTTHFTISQIGILSNTTHLPIGTYGLIVYVNDTTGSVLEETFRVTVIDTLSPTWTEMLVNQFLEVDSGFYYDLNASDPSGLHMWWLNDTTHFTISQTGIVTNNTFLPVKNYGLIVYVNDTSGNVLEGTITVIVGDSGAPTWNELPTTQVIECGTCFYYDLNASDLSGLGTWWLNDTTHFFISQTGIVTNNTFLEVGNYGLIVYVNDMSGNVLEGIFTVTVIDTISPEWREIPINQILECGTGLYYYLNASDISGLGTWWLNDTTHFFISQYGRVTFHMFIPVGNYGLIVYVNDMSGNVLEGIFTVTVIDTISPEWREIPINQILECGTGLYYDLNASDLSGLGTWWLNDTTHFAIDSSGIIVNVTFLPVGTYGLHIWVNDPFGNTLVAEITVDVVDTTHPSLLVAVIDQYLEYGEALEYQISAFDLSGIDQWSLNDTTNFGISNIGMVTNGSFLTSGQYGLNVTIADPYGNQLSVVFTVHVNSEITTTTTSDTATSTTTTDTSPDSLDPMILIIIIGGLGGIVVIVVVLWIRKSAG